MKLLPSAQAPKTLQALALPSGLPQAAGNDNPSWFPEHSVRHLTPLSLHNYPRASPHSPGKQAPEFLLIYTGGSRFRVWNHRGWAAD